MAMLRARLAAVRAATTAIRPARVELYDALDQGEKVRRRDELSGVFSKVLGPSTSAVEHAQDLDRVANQAVRHDEWRPRDHELARSRNAAGSPHFGAVRKQCFNTLDDVKRDALRGCGIVLLDVGTQRGEVVDGLGRPD